MLEQREYCATSMASPSSSSSKRNDLSMHLLRHASDEDDSTSSFTIEMSDADIDGGDTAVGVDEDAQLRVPPTNSSCFNFST